MKPWSMIVVQGLFFLGLALNSYAKENYLPCGQTGAMRERAQDCLRVNGYTSIDGGDYVHGGRAAYRWHLITHTDAGQQIWYFLGRLYTVSMKPLTYKEAENCPSIGDGFEFVPFKFTDIRKIEEHGIDNVFPVLRQSPIVWAKNSFGRGSSMFTGNVSNANVDREPDLNKKFHSICVARAGKPRFSRGLKFKRRPATDYTVSRNGCGVTGDFTDRDRVPGTRAYGSATSCSVQWACSLPRWKDQKPPKCRWVASPRILISRKSVVPSEPVAQILGMYQHLGKRMPIDIFTDLSDPSEYFFTELYVAGKDVEYIRYCGTGDYLKFIFKPGRERKVRLSESSANWPHTDFGPGRTYLGLGEVRVPGQDLRGKCVQLLDEERRVLKEIVL